MRFFPAWFFGSSAEEDQIQMAPEPIIIDPSGDVLLTLTNPGAKFAVWQHDADTNGRRKSGIEEDAVFDTSDEDSDTVVEEERPLYQEMLTNKRRKVQQLTGRPTSKRRRRGTSFGETAALVPDSDVEELQADNVRPAIVYRVSSRHLMSASPKFRSALMSDESKKSEDEVYHLETSDWDPEAYSILLNTLHLRHRQVAKKLSLEMLAKVAVLVDYYNCGEAFDLLASIWVPHVRTQYPVPAEYCRDLMLWMLVSWVFKLPEEFKDTTAKTILQSRESRVRDMGLGIPPAILEALDCTRSRTIQGVVSSGLHWLETFNSAWRCEYDPTRSFECGSMLLGALSKELKRIGFRSPKPSAPFGGKSVESVCKDVRSIRSPLWQSQAKGREATNDEVHTCSFMDTLLPDIEDILLNTEGLELADFEDRGEEAA
ncbi:hypothetical protein T440DRAFT_490845 [Plenodomus tracheiphilus IPT5]|uniref:BTB domain-containing protein n=1 Tax=Plenodomus tracheiphilus IPT5 TaxID=1408161 RepID=A0A6A7B0D3_9PLEO|nr:hypothetical protein T440DRAFT_490845 [Plenodomus tracheiphilus IPT5]